MMRYLLAPVFLLFSLSLQAQLGSKLIYSIAGNNVKAQIVDFDNDGLQDIVYVNNDFNSSTPDSIFFVRNNGSSYDPAVYLTRPFRNSGYVHRFYWADFNGDGFPDLLSCEMENVFNREIRWRVYRNNQGNGMLAGVNVFNYSIIDSQDPQAKIMDMDGDNDLDFSVGDLFGLFQSALTFRNNNGSATSWTRTNIPSSVGYAAPIIVDIDQDTIPDMLVSDHNGVDYQKGLGNNSYGTPLPLSNLATNNYMVNDLDGDMDLDILMRGVRYTENDTPSFVTQNLTTGNEYVIAVSDLNKDGYQDVISFKNNILYWKGGQANGNFYANSLMGVIHSEPIGIADANNDQVVDFYSINNGDIYLHRNLINSPYQFYGDLYYDANQNKVKDFNEGGLAFVGVELLSDGARVMTSASRYGFFTDSGTHVVSPVYPPHWGLTTDSSTYTINLTNSNPSRFNLDFGFYPSVLLTHLQASLSGSRARCNSVRSMWVNLTNLGTTRPDVTISLQLDDSIQFISSSIPQDSIVGNTLYWTLDSVDFFEEKRIQLQVQMPGPSILGDTLVSYMHAWETLLGPAGVNSYDTLSQILRCSYDPNDKAVNPIGSDSLGTIQRGQELEYLIRFQNTGNDTAYNVTIRDQLDSDLDLSTFQLISSSHNVYTEISGGGEISFNFPNIYLLDSTTNEPLSHGFVRYSIYPKATLVPKTRIENTADIYFDGNPAIVTNTVFNTIGCFGVPQPVIVQINTIALRATPPGNYSYKWYFNQNLLVGSTMDTINPPRNGNYTVTIIDSLGCENTSQAFSYIYSGIEETRPFKFLEAYPNPVEDKLNLEWEGTANEITIQVYNSTGQLLLEENAKGFFHQLNASLLSKGMYLLKIFPKEHPEQFQEIRMVK